MSEAEPALSVEGLSFAWPDGRRALDDVRFSLHAGERVALLGPNGAGKSTLLLSLLGLLGKPDPCVQVFSRPLSRKHLRWIRTRAGLLFQNPDDQVVGTRVRDDVAFGPRNLWLPQAELNARVDQALHELGIPDLAERSPMRLSVGQKKRVALAGVLAMRPDLLLLDEPGAALDPRGRRELIATLDALPQAMLIVTHDLALAGALCRRALVLDAGRVAWDGALSALMEDAERLVSLGLA